ncbi:hypothetical protein DFP92_1317 [Yoonia sediminilitoris]|uniref:Uncharacterized protein n=1 Tax=Yoonia sediminilitoris TaxID=1286148 RepID=A0A2T6K4A4_9RHOB|nr:hypothetical protein C8N45_1317 [Yoonia sediminilitoris]RCW89475.1 hypothetical protein DFP92_1317 [Yoonia sediminilitoris]
MSAFETEAATHPLVFEWLLWAVHADQIETV